MNKDSNGLTEYQRFMLFLSPTAVEREMTKIKRPIINVEPLPVVKDLQVPKNSPSIKKSATAKDKRDKKRTGSPERGSINPPQVI